MKLFALGLLAVMNVAAAQPSAISPTISPAMRLAATCAACHGTAGHTQGGTLPVLAGQSRQALAASLRDFKSGKRASTIMAQIAKGYSDEQIELLAAYFAAQKPEAQ
ncbi:c-type cytochrome [Duganella sp. FT94W]|uniref:C-type cytochrome n=1 Tax=Duganella lactea TaxID=2692173 RepID=A0ABW9VCW0_9BURK|nr:c-type cytochrome [Duganella lactea]MYM36607.1 c-type cytochrome [Duganella lactea]